MQNSLKRMYFKPRVNIQNGKNDDKQDVDFIGYFQIGDTVDVIEIDPNGNRVLTLADNISVLNIAPSAKFLVLSSVVDTQVGNLSDPANKFVIECQEIDDGQDAIDRLYRTPPTGKLNFVARENILAFALDEPSVGQGTYDVEDTTFFKVGHFVDILADEGNFVTDAEILAIENRADDANNRAVIVIDQSVDLSSATNPFFINKTIDVQQAIEINQEKIDQIDAPIENEFAETLNGVPDAVMATYETANLFRQGTAKVFLDGTRKRLGTAGTRAQLVQGAGDGELTFDSMLMGLLGNEIRIEVVSGAGLGVTITREFSASSSQILPGSTDYLIQVNNNSDAATAQEIADAINADAEARRIVQAIWGGDGSGVVAAFGPTPLTGGLDDGTGDYAELEQVFENNNSGTGYKFVAFHIRPNERNRMNIPPEDDEDIWFDYRQVLENQNR